MGVGGVVIQFAADTARAVRDISKLGRTLDGVDDATDDADDALQDLSRQADRTASDLKQAGRKMGDGIDAGARDIDRSTDSIKRDLGDAGRESGSEFVSNLAEGIGSGQARIDDVVAGTLGGLTNLAGTLAGPIGLAAGAAAGGIGLLFAAVKGEAERTKQGIQDMIDLLEDVDDISSKAASEKIWQAWLSKMRQAPQALNNINDGLKTAGITGEEFRGALTGSTEAAANINRKLQTTSDRIAEMVKKGKPLTPQQQRYLEHQADIIEALQEQGVQLGAVEQLQKDINWLTGKTAGQAGEWSSAVGSVNEETGKIEEALSRLDGRTIKINMDVRDKDGRPFRPDKVLPYTQSASGVYAATARVPYSAAAAVPAPPMGNVSEEQIYRAVSRLLVRGQARNGRRPRIA